MMFPDWFIYALVSAVFFASQRTVVRSVLTNLQNSIAFTFVHNIFAGIFLLPLLFLMPNSFHLPAVNSLLPLYLSIGAYAITDLCSYAALSLIPVSQWQIISQTRQIFLTLGGIILFHELVTSSKLGAIGIILLGILVISYDRKTKLLHNTKGIILTILASFFVVCGSLLEKVALGSLEASLIAVINFLSIGCIGSLVFFVLGKGNVIKEMVMNHWKSIASPALLFSAYKITFLIALRSGPVTSVVPVNQISIVFTILAGIFFLGEKKNLLQTILGMIAVVVGVMTLALI